MFGFGEGKYYRLTDVRDLFGRSKSHTNNLYSSRVGCLTQHIRLQPRNSKVDGLCLYAWFIQDARGNFVNRRLRTSLVSEVIEHDEGSVEVITANSIYVFEPATPLEPEFREAANLMELWLGSGDYLFDKGVHYDTDGVPHLLTCSIHLGTFQDSCLINYQDGLSITACRYFPHDHRVEFYDTIYKQQDYTTPLWIHNTSKAPLTVEFQFGGVEHIIEPGGELLVHPPKRPERRRRQ